MFMRFKKEDGTADAIYRSPEEIISDIEVVRREIKAIRERMNLRELVVELLSDERVVAEPDLWIERLEELTAEAREAEASLGELREMLLELKEELYNTQWALGLR